MKAAGSRRDRIRAQLADLKMPGALEAVDDVLTRVDGGGVTASEAIEQLLGAQIMLRNNRRLQAAMRSSRLPAIKTLDDFQNGPRRQIGAGNSIPTNDAITCTVSEIWYYSKRVRTVELGTSRSVSRSRSSSSQHLP